MRPHKDQLTEKCQAAENIGMSSCRLGGGRLFCNGPRARRIIRKYWKVSVCFNEHVADEHVADAHVAAGGELGEKWPSSDWCDGFWDVDWGCRAWKVARAGGAVRCVGWHPPLSDPVVIGPGGTTADFHLLGMDVDVRESCELPTG
jgi:hypothetical protein